MKTLVVTGGIGSGKSTVCRYFASRGIPVYDSDSRTRSLYDRCPELVSRIGEVLGCSVTGPDGRIDRRKLASVIFSDSSMLEKLEGIELVCGDKVVKRGHKFRGFCFHTIHAPGDHVVNIYVAKNRNIRLRT